MAEFSHPHPINVHTKIAVNQLSLKRMAITPGTLLAGASAGLYTLGDISALYAGKQYH